MENWESPVERAIREAQERGEFDNLPGAGKPLRNLGSRESRTRTGGSRAWSSANSST